MDNQTNQYTGGKCPSKEQMLRFSDGEIEGEEKTPLAGHLSECPKCKYRLQRLFEMEDARFAAALQTAETEKDADPVEIPFPLTAEKGGGNGGNTRSLFWYVSCVAAAVLFVVIPWGAWHQYQKNAAETFFVAQLADADFTIAQTTPTPEYRHGEGANTTDSSLRVAGGGNEAVTPEIPKTPEERAAKFIESTGFAQTKITADVLAAKNMTAADKYWLLTALFGLKRYEEGKIVADDLEKDDKAYPHHIKKIALYREKLKLVGLSEL